MVVEIEKFKFISLFIFLNDNIIQYPLNWDLKMYSLIF